MEPATEVLQPKSLPQSRACNMGEGGKGYTRDVVGDGGPRVLASSELLPFILLLSLHVPWNLPCYLLPKTNFLWFNLPPKTHEGDKSDLGQDMLQGWR